MYIFWDFNGTILDDKILCLDILNEMLDKYENKKVTLEQYLEIFTFPIIDYYNEVFDLNKTPFEVLALDFIDKYQERSLREKLSHGVEDVFKYFKEKGFKQVVLSASEINNLKEQLEHYNILHYFDDVLGTSDVYAASKIEVGVNYINNNNINKSKAIIIGDTIHDAEVASEMGIDVIIYTGGHQSKNRLSKYKTFDHFDQLKEGKFLWT